LPRHSGLHAVALALLPNQTNSDKFQMRVSNEDLGCTPKLLNPSSVVCTPDCAKKMLHCSLPEVQLRVYYCNFILIL